MVVSMVESQFNGSDGLLARLHRRTACIAVVALSTLFHDPRKRKRELRAAAGEPLIRSSYAPSRVPRIFLGLGQGRS
jgi:hypothetical protein